MGVEVGDWGRGGEKKNQYFGGGRGSCIFFCLSKRVNLGFCLIQVSDAFSFSFLVDLQWNNGGQRKSNHWKRRALTYLQKEPYATELSTFLQEKKTQNNLTFFSFVPPLCVCTFYIKKLGLRKTKEGYTVFGALWDF